MDISADKPTVDSVVFNQQSFETVRGLIFDMGDVLYDSSLWRRWLFQLLQRIGVHSHFRAFYHVWDRDFLPNVNVGQADFWETLRSFLASVGLTPGEIEETIAASYARRIRIQDELRPFPKVRQTLATLRRQGVVMTAVSNSPLEGRELQQRLHRLGLDTYINRVVSSRDIGAAMPERAMYEAALTALAVAPEQAAFVGHDSFELTGANQAGIATIAFNHGAEAAADIFLQQFDELPCVLSSAKSLNAAA